MSFVEFWPTLIQGLGVTVTITASSFILGALLAIPVAVLRQSPFAPARLLAVSFVEFLRGVPPIAWLFVIFFGLPQFEIRLDAIPAAIIGFSLISAAYISEIYRAGLRSLAEGQREAAAALGLSRLIAYRKVLVPQAVRVMIPLGIAYLISLLKESAIASVLGIADIAGLAVLEARRTFEGLEVFISAAFLYLAMSVPIGLLGRYVGARLAAEERSAARV